MTDVSRPLFAVTVKLWTN